MPSKEAQDGRSASLTAPNGPAQEKCIKAVLRECKLTPTEVDCIECHGTGTPGASFLLSSHVSIAFECFSGSLESLDLFLRALGDPIEVGSFKKAWAHFKASESRR